MAKKTTSKHSTFRLTSNEPADLEILETWRDTAHQDMQRSPRGPDHGNINDEETEKAFDRHNEQRKALPHA